MKSFVYDGSKVVAVLDVNSTLTNRYLHGAMVDQVFADEHSTGLVHPRLLVQYDKSALKRAVVYCSVLDVVKAAHIKAG